jgi:hypothetical protein
MPSRVKSLANEALKPSPAPTINAVLYILASMTFSVAATANCCAPSIGRAEV